VLAGGERIAAMSAVMTVIGIGWGITWFTYACDYSRFVSTTVPQRRLYVASVLGQFIPVVWLGVLGASLATTNGSVDPGKLIVSSRPTPYTRQVAVYVPKQYVPGTEATFSDVSRNSASAASVGMLSASPRRSGAPS